MDELLVDSLATLFFLPSDIQLSPCQDSFLHFVVTLRRFVAGVILTALLPTFERLLWRVCQGNVFVKHETIAFGLFHPQDEVSSVLIS